MMVHPNTCTPIRIVPIGLLDPEWTVGVEKGMVSKCSGQAVEFTGDNNNINCDRFGFQVIVCKSPPGRLTGNSEPVLSKTHRMEECSDLICYGCSLI